MISPDRDVLPRTLADLYGQVREYFVYREDQGPIMGVAALHIFWADLGEIRSVAVVPDFHQSRGIGSRLVKNAWRRPGAIGLSEDLPPHPRPDFFQRFGFQVVPGKTCRPSSGPIASTASNFPIATKSPCSWT